MKRVVARAPNHLGDGVMALPAMHALSTLGPLTIFAPSWGRDLYRDVRATVTDRGFMGRADLAVLFAPSLRAAWEARCARRRVGTPTDHRWALLTDVVERQKSRAGTYAALAERAGVACQEAPSFRIHPEDSAPDVPLGHIGFNPLSASGVVREWPGFGALAEGWSLPVVFYAGPGEEERLRGQVGTKHPHCVGLALPDFAQALSKCRVFVSVDTGPAHFARACGVPTVVVYGSTSPERTGPWGSVGVEGGPLACRPCYRQSCAHDLECMNIPVDEVRETVLGVLAVGDD
jgi:heptosyltransferase-2